MIELKNLHKSYGKLNVLKGISLEFENSGITAILGPNGSGKTTMIKCLLGMVIPQKGDILINNENIRGKWEYRQKVSYLPQIARFPENLTVQELLKMIKDLRNASGTNEKELIKRFKLEKELNKKLNTLSGGTKQKVNIVQAFMFDSPIIILDEPTAGLDPVALIRFKDLLKEVRAEGKKVIFTTHIMSFVEELADNIIFLLEGNIYYQGTVEKLEERFGEERLEGAIAKILLQENGQIQNLKGYTVATE